MCLTLGLCAQGAVKAEEQVMRNEIQKLPASRQAMRRMVLSHLVAHAFVDTLAALEQAMGGRVPSPAQMLRLLHLTPLLPWYCCLLMRQCT
jgi:hypothetical protein